ncbi:NSs protein [Umbre virus]|uniref:Non-structural protein NS-S n=1 Tax=Umbre virus TaxID=552554 RepID=A0A0R7FK66_9VIRU|nr:NSs protein [Umbre virus]AKO90198.1 NSs protein [Umbre virus]
MLVEVLITQQMNTIRLWVSTENFSQLITLESSSSTLQRPKLRWLNSRLRQLRLRLEHSSSSWLITIELDRLSVRLRTMS